MSLFRSSQLENYGNWWAENELERAYFLESCSILGSDNNFYYMIHDDVTDTILFSACDWEFELYEDEEKNEEHFEKYDQYILEKYKHYMETLNTLRSKENENLYKAEKTFSRSISF